MSTKPSPAALLAAIRRRGSDARDLRDGAHEACHAIEVGMKRGWGREAIHAKLTRANARSGFGRAGLVAYELRARAVEQIVCADFSVDCGSVDEWADVTWWETIKNMHIQLPSVEWIAEGVRRYMKQANCRRLADKVIALGVT